jgi:flagellar hook-associated protein 3 FlgL
MRVGTPSLYAGIQQRLQRLTSDLNNLNEKIASGKEINNPSDDPVAFVHSMQLKTALTRMDQYERNLQTATSWMSLSESALSNTLNLLERARELTVEMASDTQTAEARATAAVEVGELLDQAISLGNTKLARRYIFSGYLTETAPFTKVTVGGIETAQYNGDTNNFQLQIGKKETLMTGWSGQAVFMDSTLFNTLGTLKKALEDNDSATIAAQVDSLAAVEGHLPDRRYRGAAESR